MAGRQAAIIQLSAKQQHILESFAKGTHTALHVKQRATIILRASEGWANLTIAQQTGWNRNTVKWWRNRWAQTAAEVTAQETLKPWAFRHYIKSVLQDAPRPGKPCRFTPEQIAQMVTLACRTPEDVDVPLTHWTPSALAREAVRQGIVAKISPRQVGRFLKRRPI